MKADIAKKWVEALRSDKYKQGRGALRCHDQFCCLGVLCDVVKDEVGGHWVPIDIDDDEDPITQMTGFVIGDTCTDDALPETVRQFVGMSTVLGGLTTESGLLTTLAVLNDSGVYDFDDIAAVIESNAEKL